MSNISSFGNICPQIGPLQAVITFVCVILIKLIPFREIELFTSFSVLLFSPLYISGFHCLDQNSHYLQFSCFMLPVQDGIKTFQVSYHTAASTVLILIFLPFMCSTLDLHVHRFDINCLITCLYFCLSGLKGDKSGKESKGGVTVIVNSLPRIHLERQI